MRDACRGGGGGGALVAAAVAILEKQQILNGSTPPSTSGFGENGSTQLKLLLGEDNDSKSRFTSIRHSEETRKRSPTNSSNASSSSSKNNPSCLGEARPDANRKPTLRNSQLKADDAARFRADENDADNFESAIKDFDLTAEDVQKFVLRSNRERDADKTDFGQECPTFRFFGKTDRFFSSNTEFTSSASDDFGTDSSEATCSESESESEREHVINEGLETITEEDRLTASSIQSTEGGDSSSLEDDSTLKGNEERWSGSVSNRESTSDLSSSSSDHHRLQDSSTRCNDFQWILKDSDKPSNSPKMEEQIPQSKPPINRSSGGGGSNRDKTPRKSAEKGAPGSLDRRRHHAQSRHERDQKSRSSHVIKSPPRFDDFLAQTCQSWCCNPHAGEPVCYENFHRRHERMDPQRYGSSPLLMEQRFIDRGSHSDLYSDCSSRYRHETPPMGCCSYHMAPPCCFYGDVRNFHWTPPPPFLNKPQEQDERYRKLQGERDNLQLQVQVLTEQIEAQTEKIVDLEKSLGEKKQVLMNTEDMLQRILLKWGEYSNDVQFILQWNESLKTQSSSNKSKTPPAASPNLPSTPNITVESPEKHKDLQKSLTYSGSHHSSADNVGIVKGIPQVRLNPLEEMLSRSSLETQKLELMSALSELKLQHAELERELIHLRSSQYNNNSSADGANKKNHLLPRMSPQPHHTSTPVHHSSNQNLNVRMSPSSSPLSGSLTASPRRTESTPLQHEIQPPKTPPATYKRQIDLQYASLPRQQFLSNGGSLSVVDSNANPADGARKGVAFAETEKIVIEDGADPSQSPSLQFNKNKGIKKIFGKLKRSGSGNLEDLPGIGEFQRGGVRATAAARLGWSEPQITPKPEKPVEQWTNDDICNWLQDLGLEQYTAEAKRWGKTGEDFLKSSSEIAEKEFGIKNILHRKKLQLALIDAQENGSSDPYLSKAGKLDTAWVMRWLDDTGLPQHKEMFLVNRVDGRVLHRLTMDDLGLLHITSLLHVASIKRGIQVLRENNYEPGCLQRRSLPEDPTQPTPKQISLWTTHRVMEWLKAVDLAEYAPNLRGSGVHGGLMVLENKFTAELLASLLSIPLGKTLLRRHLNTHFKELLGKDVIQVKREAEATLGYIPLTPSSKLKVTKKSHFSLKRSRSKSEADYGDLVCPMNAGSQSGEQNGSTLNNSLGMKKMDEVKEEDASHLADENFIIDSSSPSSTSSPVPDRRTV